MKEQLFGNITCKLKRYNGKPKRVLQGAAFSRHWCGAKY